MTIVPYRSIPQGLQALVTGEADLMWVGAAAGEDLISTGKILQLGVATRQPWSVLSVEHALFGTWDEYVPILARLVHRDLLEP